MAVKAVGRVRNIRFNVADNTKVDVEIQCVGLVASAGQEDTLFISAMDPSILNTLWETALKQELRTHAITGWGYSFGLLDTVRLCGETLL